MALSAQYRSGPARVWSAPRHPLQEWQIRDLLYSRTPQYHNWHSPVPGESERHMQAYGKYSESWDSLYIFEISRSIYCARFSISIFVVFSIFFSFAIDKISAIRIDTNKEDCCPLGQYGNPPSCNCNLDQLFISFFYTFIGFKTSFSSPNISI